MKNNRQSRNTVVPARRKKYEGFKNTRRLQHASGKVRP